MNFYIRKAQKIKALENGLVCHSAIKKISLQSSKLKKKKKKEFMDRACL